MIELICGNSVELMSKIPDQTIDAIITDPPYPEISREYGRMSEAEWWELIMGICKEARRVLKPTGSAVFIFQPNCQKLGSMRSWLWDFMSWTCHNWNIIQDVYWWNITAITEAMAIQGKMMRPSIKTCVWAGPSDCYKNQDKILWRESEGNKGLRAAARFGDVKKPSGHHSNNLTAWQAAERRGGVTPFNLLPIAHDSTNGAGSYGHGAGTPLELAKWWTRYICPSDGTILDPFVGSGTMMLAAIEYGCNGIGMDKMQKYIDMATMRVREAQQQLSLL